MTGLQALDFPLVCFPLFFEFILSLVELALFYDNLSFILIFIFVIYLPLLLHCVSIFYPEKNFKQVTADTDKKAIMQIESESKIMMVKCFKQM